MQAFPGRILHFLRSCRSASGGEPQSTCAISAPQRRIVQEVSCLMSSDEKVLDFPRVEVTSEEKARRVMVEATRLARLAPGEWRLWIDRSALRSSLAGWHAVCGAVQRDNQGQREKGAGCHHLRWITTRKTVLNGRCRSRGVHDSNLFKSARRETCRRYPPLRI